MTSIEALHFKRTANGLRQEVVSPRNSPSDGLELALASCRPSDPYSEQAAGKESLVVILGGRCSISVEGMSAWADLGARADVFGGRATCVYVPPGRAFRVETADSAELALLRAPAPEGGEPYLIRPEDVAVSSRGSGAFRRQVHTFLDESRPAGTLVAGETYNEPGAWSSYPPHKHDVDDPPRQAKLQEVYHFRLQPAQGFGIQRIYSPERGIDLSLTVEDGDTVLIPFGYHPVVAGPGYRLYYLWALAGTGRQLLLQEDPAHSWVAG